MLRNFLLSKISVLALTAIVLNSLIVPAWSMDEGENEKKKSSAILAKNSNNTDENENNNGDGSGNTTSTQQDHFTGLPQELKFYILERAAFNLGAAKEGLSNLALVCKDWSDNIVKNEAQNIKHSIRQSWIYGRCGRNDIKDATEQEIFGQFYKGVLIYRPIMGSDERMITLRIADLSNPLEDTFDLSQCGNSGQYLSIATGYRKVQTPANAEKLEVWLTPRFLVTKEMAQMAPNHHMRVVIRKWDAANHVGVFWTWGGWNAGKQIGATDYLITESMARLGSDDLLSKYKEQARRRPKGGIYLCIQSIIGWMEGDKAASHFTLSF